MDSDLVCAASQGQTADDTVFSIKAKPLEDGSALLSFRVNPAEANFKGNNQNWLLADQLPLWKLPFYSAYILLFQLLEKHRCKGTFLRIISMNLWKK